MEKRVVFRQDNCKSCELCIEAVSYTHLTGTPEINQKQDLADTTVVTNRVPVRDRNGNLVGAVAVFRDITEFKTLAEEITNLKQIQSLLSAVINSDVYKRQELHLASGFFQ